MTNKDLLIRYVKLAAKLTEYQMNKLNSNLKKSYFRRRLREFEAAGHRLEVYEINAAKDVYPEEISEYIKELPKQLHLSNEEMKFLGWSPEQIFDYWKNKILNGNYIWTDKEFETAPDEIKNLQITTKLSKDEHLRQHEFFYVSDDVKRDYLNKLIEKSKWISDHEKPYLTDDMKFKIARNSIAKGYTSNISAKHLGMVTPELQKMWVTNSTKYSYSEDINPEFFQVLHDETKEHYIKIMVSKGKKLSGDELKFLTPELKRTYVNYRREKDGLDSVKDLMDPAEFLEMKEDEVIKKTLNYTESRWSGPEFNSYVKQYPNRLEPLFKKLVKVSEEGRSKPRLIHSSVLYNLPDKMLWDYIMYWYEFDKDTAKGLIKYASENLRIEFADKELQLTGEVPREFVYYLPTKYQDIFVMNEIKLGRQVGPAYTYHNISPSVREKIREYHDMIVMNGIKLGKKLESPIKYTLSPDVEKKLKEYLGS